MPEAADALTQVAINEGADLSDLSDNAAVERDCYVYRSYIALGSHQARRALPRHLP